MNAKEARDRTCKYTKNTEISVHVYNINKIIDKVSIRGGTWCVYGDIDHRFELNQMTSIVEHYNKAGFNTNSTCIEKRMLIIISW